MTNDPKEIAHIAGGLLDGKTVEVLLEFAPRLHGEIGPSLWDKYAQYRDHRYDPPLGSARPSTKPHRVFLKCWFRFVADFCGDEVRWRSQQDGYSEKAGGHKLVGDEAKFEAFNDCGKLAFLTAKVVYPELNFDDVREVMKNRIRSGANLYDYSVDPNEKPLPVSDADDWANWETDRQRKAAIEQMRTQMQQRLERGEEFQDAMKDVAKKVARLLF